MTREEQATMHAIQSMNQAMRSIEKKMEVIAINLARIATVLESRDT